MSEQEKKSAGREEGPREGVGGDLEGWCTCAMINKIGRGSLIKSGSFNHIPITTALFFGTVRGKWLCEKTGPSLRVVAACRQGLLLVPLHSHQVFVSQQFSLPVFLWSVSELSCGTGLSRGLVFTEICLRLPLIQ